MSGKVLLVDDSNFIRKVVASFMAEKGFTVITAENGRQGVELAKSNMPDYIVSDLVMNDFDGFYLLENLPVNVVKKVFILSSDIQETTHERIAGFKGKFPIHFFNKPLKKEILEAMFEKMKE